MDEKTFKSILEEFTAKVDEKIELRAKQFYMGGQPEQKAALDKAKELSLTGQFLTKLLNGDRNGAIEISKKSWGDGYTKALNTTTDAPIIPVDFATEIIKTMPNFSAIRRNAKIRPMRSKTVSLNELTARVSAAKVSELANITTTKPTYTAPLVTAEDYAGGVLWSYQLERDSEIDILKDLTEQFAAELARAEQFSFINSAVSGSEGIMTVSGTSTYVLGGAANSGRTTFASTGADDIEKAAATIRQLNVGVSNPKLYIAADVLSAISSKTVSNVGYQEMMKIEYRNGKIYAIAGVPVEEITGANVLGVAMLPALVNTAVTTNFAFIADLSQTFVIGERSGIEVLLLDQGTIIDEAAASINLTMSGGKYLRALKSTGQKVVRASEIIKLRTSTT